MRVDHLVWYCTDLDLGCCYFSDCLDAAPTYGGIHPGEGTRNALVALGDQTYIEILARDPEQPEASLESEVRALRGEGIYHWAAGGADVEALRARSAEAGLNASDLITDGRTLPSGGWLGWRWNSQQNHENKTQEPNNNDRRESAQPAMSVPRGGTLV